MFEAVPPFDTQLTEKTVLDFWREQQIFQRSITERRSKGGQPYVFYEGPPTANGKPGVHHALSRAFKDIFLRYHTMNGRYVLRRGGWDTHGLPVEIEVEKKLGFSGKEQIERYGIAEFNALCRQSAFDYIQEWERFTERLGFWVDFETAYVTYHNSYIESVWSILKNFGEKDLLYQGYKVVPYCTRCGTPLSDHEVAQGYEDNTPDPSVFVRFPLRDQPDTALLVWTTTPWTLPANAGCAVAADVEYALVAEDDGRKLILASALLTQVFGEKSYNVLRTFPGRELLGQHYQPPFQFIEFSGDAHYVVAADFVTTDNGTGIVHMAPAFGADDLAIGQQYGLPVLLTVDSQGKFIPAVTTYAGLWVKDADPHIIADLRSMGLLFKAETYLHTYPFCWRCHTPLLYYARTTWYIRTSAFKERLVALNQTINWEPSHIRNGRFGNWLENNVDWALGRERYWGTPLPVWRDESGAFRVVGSRAELSALAGRDLSDLDLHRPYVDDVQFINPETGLIMQRVPEVIDVWFDSGAMPMAQWHYPFENQTTFAEQFPADYICEAVDQTRGWFYALHAIGTLLHDSVAFKNVVCLGHILDGNGQKMSKSKGNIINPWSVFDEQGADAFRWYLYTASPAGNPRRFSLDLVGEVVRNFMLPLWNTYSFFVTYANLDGWQPQPNHPNTGETNIDTWIISELHSLIANVTAGMERYDAQAATRPIEQFLENLSNWYVRRSRRRFWKSDQPADQHAAYNTLYECLVTLAHLLAPSMPFLAETLYQNLVAKINPAAPLSIHLSNWPVAQPSRIQPTLNTEMAVVQRVVSLGHAARSKANRKVRQPLASAAFWLGSGLADSSVQQQTQLIEKYRDLIADELNVKEVRLLASATEALSYQLHPLPKQLGQKYGKQLPAIRQALQALPDPTEFAETLLAGNPAALTLADTVLHILPGEVEVRPQSKSGFAVASEAGLVAALTIELSDALIREGLARDFVRTLQEQRKQQGFAIADRIHVRYAASASLAAAISEYQGYIMSEVLARSLTSEPSLATAALTDDNPVVCILTIAE